MLNGCLKFNHISKNIITRILGTQYAILLTNNMHSEHIVAPFCAY